MTITICDICDTKLTAASIRVTVKDGVYPSNQSPMTRVIDCCASCVGILGDLRSQKELADARREHTAGKSQ